MNRDGGNQQSQDHPLQAEAGGKRSYGFEDAIPEESTGAQQQAKKGCAEWC